MRNDVIYFYKGAISITEAETMPITKLIRLHNDLRRLLKKEGKIK